MAGAVMLLASACANGDEEAEPETPAGPEETTSPGADGTEDPVDPVTPTEEAPDGGADPDLHVPDEGAELIVVGVGYPHGLNIRQAAGQDAEVLLELSPLTEQIVATGAHETIGDREVWVEVTADDVTGWASFDHLAYRGETLDITDQFDDPPTAGSTSELAWQTGVLRAGSDEDLMNTEVILVDTGEGMPDLVGVVELTGYPDDAQLGERLHVHHMETGAGGPDDRYGVALVESILLCRRGVAEGGCL